MIGIVWRNDKQGKGAFWDHYRFQSLLGKTAIIEWGENKATDTLFAYQNKMTFKLPSFPTTKNPSDDDIKILVIPGIADGEGDFSREAFEDGLLREFFGRKPILLICGGVWRLTALGAKVGPVALHASGQGMMRLNDKGAVTHVVDLHTVVPCTWSKDHPIWAGQFPDSFPANSVHQNALKSIDENHFEVLAMSGEAIQMYDKKTREFRLRKDRQKHEMECPSCIEAVISTNSDTRAPLLAIQWHAEAYPSKTVHAKMLQYVYNWRPIEQFPIALESRPVALNYIEGVPLESRPVALNYIEDRNPFVAHNAQPVGNPISKLETPQKNLIQRKLKTGDYCVVVGGPRKGQKGWIKCNGTACYFFADGELLEKLGSITTTLLKLIE